MVSELIDHKHILTDCHGFGTFVLQTNKVISKTDVH